MDHFYLPPGGAALPVPPKPWAHSLPPFTLLSKSVELRAFLPESGRLTLLFGRELCSSAKPLSL